MSALGLGGNQWGILSVYKVLYNMKWLDYPISMKSTA